MILEYRRARLELFLRSDQLVPSKVKAALGAPWQRQHSQVVATAWATQLDVKFGPVRGFTIDAILFHQDHLPTDY